MEFLHDPSMGKKYNVRERNLGPYLKISALDFVAWDCAAREETKPARLMTERFSWKVGQTIL